MSGHKERKFFPATGAALLVLGEEIKHARKRRGYSETYLAQRVGCSRETIRSIEAGKTTVKVGLVFEAAARVGLFVFGTEEELRHRRDRIQDAMTTKRT